MKKPLLHLDRLSPADLGKFSVLLSQLLNNRQRASLNVAIPSIMEQVGASIVPQANTTSVISNKDWQKLEQLAQGGRYVECIKLVRNISGLGLKEAKDYVDKFLKVRYH